MQTFDDIEITLKQLKDRLTGSCFLGGITGLQLIVLFLMVCGQLIL